MKATWNALSLLPCALLAVVLAACGGGGNGGTGRALAGTIRDSRTGAPVAGVAVDYAGHSATSAADGSYRIDLADESGTVSGPFCAHASGYEVMYISPALLSGSDESLSFSLTPLSTASYPTRTITLVIRDSTGNQIPNNTMFGYWIFNSSGGCTGTAWSPSYYVTDGFVVTSPTFGSDCLVAVLVFTGSPWNVMTDHVNLSSSVTVPLVQDATPGHTTAVTVTGNGDTGNVCFDSPYGIFLASNFSVPPSAALQITNPLGYNVFWTQSKTVTDYLPGVDKSYAVSSTPVALASSVTLPNVDTSIGPTAAPVIASMTYSGGTLSIPPVAGANLYQFTINDSTLGNVTVMSSDASVALPSWMITQLSGHSDSVSLMAIYVDISMDASILKEIARTRNGIPAMAFHQGMIDGGSTTISF